MKKSLLPLGTVLIMSSCQTEKSISPAETMELKVYPKTEKIIVEDDYFGTLVEDPYRWLEDDMAENTKAWVAQQNEVTQHYLNQIPFREDMKKRLTELWNYEKFSAPMIHGDYIYFFKNDGLQNQSVLYRQKGENGEVEVFLDPNTFSSDGTTSLAGYSFNQDGSLFAYQVSQGGSDWTKMIILDTQDKSQIGDTLENIKFSGIAWKGNEGIYYSSYDKPEGASALSAMTDRHKLYFHKLGTSQSDDQLIYGGSGDPIRYIGAYLTEDECYLVITAANATSGNALIIQDLSKPNSPFVNVVDNMDKTHHVLNSQGDELLIYTNLDAPNGKVVKVSAKNPQPSFWEEVIPEAEEVLSPSMGAGKIFAHYLKDARSVVKQFDLDGNLEREIELPGFGSASGFSGKMDDSTLYYSFASYVYPPSIFKYDVANGTSEIYKESGVNFDPSQYESKQVFYTSKDGTKIPMMITHKKGIKLDGSNPTLLYGYGGFNISLTPGFSTSNIILLEQGGIYAVANIRGGGEYGEKWHLAGTKMQKQNVFDDFITAAEYLINEKYTSKEKLGLSGGSNGGLLVGAVMTQRPDLFQVAFPAVGVLDMLRYNQFTAGAGWAFDYGTAQESEEMFQYLYKYSPYHALKSGVQYPSTLVTTADHDDRVVPAHSFKFAARLQEYHQGENPVLIRIETNAGHGAGKSTEMVISEQVDKWAFLFQETKTPYLPKTK